MLKDISEFYINLEEVIIQGIKGVTRVAFIDAPITSKEYDLLKRDNFAALLAQTILELNNEDTFTVGLFGEWGCGKTSLINMILENMELLQPNLERNKKLIIIKFEPWNFSTQDQLLTQFFIRLANEFRSKNDDRMLKLGELLEEYADAFQVVKVIPVCGSFLSALIQPLARFLSKKMKKGYDAKDILMLKANVINLIQEQQQKILVVIDDMDRLNNEQIRQVFQLVAAVAKFPNMTYLLAFDKKNVIKALEQIQEGSGEEYLEKIVQMPIEVPPLKKEALFDILFHRLDKIIVQYEDISFSMERWQRLFYISTSFFLKNLRDLNRLSNNLQFKFAAVAKEVDFVDIFVISSLEIYQPRIYEWIKANKKLLVGETDYMMLGDRDKSQQECLVFYKNKFIDILCNIKELTNEENAENMIEIISELFPHFAHKVGKVHLVNEYDELLKNNRVGHPTKFDRYFNLNLNEIAFKKEDIEYMINKSSKDELEEFVRVEEDKECLYEFLEEVRARINMITDSRIRIIINTLGKNANSTISFRKNTGLFPLRTSDYAKTLIIDLIDKLSQKDRFTFICFSINQSYLDELETWAGIINRLELAYGRLAANGEEQGYNKIITLDELIKLEEIFCSRMKDLLNENNLFDNGKVETIIYLLENFEEDDTKKYFQNLFNENENILKYLKYSIQIFNSGKERYQIKDYYKKYLNENQILDAIIDVKSQNKLFGLHNDIQNATAAFYLYLSKQQETIWQSDVEKLLEEWKILECK